VLRPRRADDDHTTDARRHGHDLVTSEVLDGDDVTHHEQGKGVNTVTTFTSEELLSEAVELLPARETLSMGSGHLGNWANISATNVALVVNTNAWLTSAHAFANQAVILNQR